MSSPNQLSLFDLIQDCYQIGCHYLNIIPYKQVVFKGFYSEKLFTEISNNQQIAQSLRLSLNDPQQKQEFAELLQRVPKEFAGLTWALTNESWITFNPAYCQPLLQGDLSYLLCHEIAHAVLHNLDIYWGHSSPHSELTAYLWQYCQKKYSHQQLVKLLISWWETNQ
ncbi:SprT family zinc-dependent metalloprotease [endosymbiont GvMRE of Glomus versiforme]|uniref:SprT family zinc-dependent metalloprotease n=1 Tax=endosymbiont GvMRE of Glomus versiforme TaxID=2039283 RepID=UPI000EC13EF9|nr:SprT family zinc-dependent metalloprotease [endosymbiont GvMRE of Glomus versiforme]RHZ36113.1 hypothetical protein GvMRE_Ic2g40 [endosymbiont GvMRE of Glomus versiforme]